ncbi:MAG: hypothetical protein DWB42_00760 [Chloroflexi bacterium]|nr:hypothetical protein [Chloroflexota bacterium]MDL1882036.1 hypothetical protein [Anaerolineae bacterium CFX8]
MSEITPGGSSTPDWKPRVYVVGLLAGALFGLVASYLYARAAEEDARGGGGKPRPMTTGDIVTLALAGLGIVRQVSEMGRPPKKR